MNLLCEPGRLDTGTGSIGMYALILYIPRGYDNFDCSVLTEFYCYMKELREKTVWNQ